MALIFSILFITAQSLISQTHAFHTSSEVPLTLQTRHSASTTSLATVASRTAPSVVVDKFDSYASNFESHLVDIVDNLKYCAPQSVASAASERITNDRNGKLYSSSLDAGCGTGLAGPGLRQLVSGSLIGVDLSPKMAELAAELVIDDGPIPMVENRMRRCAETARTAFGSDAPNRLYDGVFTADLLNLSGANFLDGFGHKVQKIPTEHYDLIVSADVLVYFGAMDDILKVFSDALAVGGDVIFTTETMKCGDYNWVETSSGRYAQSPDYVARMASEAGLTKVSQEAFTPRNESGEKVLG
eukprot:CAMPEP_0172320198 /NCGR_PEP_ID=MMETSP1058-20130122/39929_1 /TAXON_ID=83371 /ORGANISM="Detonula confervacea, Strain CCMP 353" /LENGTH=299 /DNA_ID=CAMNT_0013035417 /DNA_START=123 /DNA_END=1018 /DNA_ORIENTATION=-